MEPTYFKLYARTGHLRLQISSEEYRKLFETVWQDRAAAAGWNLQVEYNGQECTFRFRH